MSWSFRTAKRVVNYSSPAIADLLFDSIPAIKWSNDASFPYVSYSVKATNIGTHVLFVDLEIACVAVLRSDRNNKAAEQKISSANYAFKLTPGLSTTLNGRLMWAETANYVPWILTPGDGYTLISAEYENSTSLAATKPTPAPRDAIATQDLSADHRGRQQPETQLGALVDSSKSAFGDSLMEIIAAAPSGFIVIRSSNALSPAGDGFVHTSAVPLSGAVETEVWTEDKDSEPYVFATMYSGASASEAQTVFGQFVNEFRAVLLAGWTEKVSKGKGAGANPLDYTRISFVNDDSPADLIMSLFKDTSGRTGKTRYKVCIDIREKSEWRHARH
jgi:hypothetical protein